MLPKLDSLNLVTPEDFNKRAKEVFGEKATSEYKPKDDNREHPAETPKSQKRNSDKLSWIVTGHHQAFKQLEPPHWLLPFKDDTEITNFIYTALSCFISATIERPNPTYTFLDIRVPDQLQERLQADTICFDAQIKGKIFIYR